MSWKHAQDAIQHQRSTSVPSRGTFFAVVSGENFCCDKNLTSRNAAHNCIPARFRVIGSQDKACRPDHTLSLHSQATACASSLQWKARRRQVGKCWSCQGRDVLDAKSNCLVVEIKCSCVNMASTLHKEPATKWRVKHRRGQGNRGGGLASQQVSALRGDAPGTAHQNTDRRTLSS
jgi:hypothetical protein